jgi:uncharacterized membrane protein
LTVTVLVVGVLTVLGLIAFWPRGEAPDLGDQPGNYVKATITSARESACPGIEVEGRDACLVYSARLSSGPEDGQTVEFQVLQTETEVPKLDEGDKVVLLDIDTNPDPRFRYTFFDYQRETPLLWLGIAFAVVVVAFGRFQGVRALAGLALSLLVLVAFVVPALLRNSPAVLVALLGTITVAYLALYLAHGFKLSTTIALVGSLVSLALTATLALAAASWAQLSGLANHEAQILRFTAEALDLKGLLIAGIVVGALGVLDDVTVSQVSTVAALRRANPSFSARQLYAEATRVGRDHVASTVNTLVLAYAGASLPLLLFFAQGSQPTVRIITGELMAVEIVRMLVGSIGLVLSVPITTRLAAVVLSRTDRIPEDDGHGHGHGPVPAPLAPLGPAPGTTRRGPRWDDLGPSPDNREPEPWF